MAPVRSAATQVPLLKPAWIVGCSPLVAPQGVLIYKKEMQIAEVVRITSALHIPIRNVSLGASGATERQPQEATPHHAGT